MDEMKLESKWTRGIASMFLGKVIRNKFGYDIDVQLNHFRTTVLEDKAHVHLDVDLELTKEELDSLRPRLCHVIATRKCFLPSFLSLLSIGGLVWYCGENHFEEQHVVE